MNIDVENSKTDLLLEINNISKSFPGVRALDNVGLTLKRGEILGLVGENGAGKSTLMKIIAGAYQADKNEGEILLNGRITQYKSPFEAKNDGIVMIFQELSLVMDLSVAENIYLGSLPRLGRGIIDWNTLYINSQKVLRSIGCQIDPRIITTC
jgi:putative multiple sugar transport system ATP-binding protein